MVKKINYTALSKIFIVVYCLIMVIYSSIYVPRPIGEWDDYSLMTSSIMSQHDITISDGDIEEYKNIFPDFSQAVDRYRLSGLYAKNGGEMPWYFPTYSAACIPMIKLLQIMGLRASNGFAYTNIASMAALLLIVLFCLKAGEKRKFGLIVLLSINPVIFYFNWISSEAFMYSLLGIAMVFHFNKWHKLSAIFLAVCGTMNPTILAAGIVFIFEYLIEILSQKLKTTGFWKYILSRLKEIILYGLCWVIALVPFAYNYYNVGYINLTAANPNFTKSADSVLSRMIAYLFDVNYGILPYFSLLLIFALILIIPAIIRKKWHYLSIMAAFFAVAYSYSIMSHVNCGMSGMARYNEWNAVLLIFAVVMYFDKIITKKIITSAFKISFAIEVFACGIIINCYGVNKSMYADFKYMTPIADFILDNAPCLYNPLHSTFNSRTTHVDGGYIYETPIINCDKNGYVRKILATKSDTDTLIKSIHGNDADKEWFAKKIESLGESEKYINIPKSKKLVKACEYKPGDEILFCNKDYNANKYIISGFGASERDFTWTIRKNASLNIKIDSEKKKFHCSVDVGNTYLFARDIIFKINGETVYTTNIKNGRLIEFDFENPEEITGLTINIPSAEALDIYQKGDTRELGLEIKKIVITEK